MTNKRLVRISSTTIPTVLVFIDVAAELFDDTGGWIATASVHKRAFWGNSLQDFLPGLSGRVIDKLLEGQPQLRASIAHGDFLFRWSMRVTLNGAVWPILPISSTSLPGVSGCSLPTRLAALIDGELWKMTEMADARVNQRIAGNEGFQNMETLREILVELISAIFGVAPKQVDAWVSRILGRLAKWHLRFRHPTKFGRNQLSR